MKYFIVGKTSEKGPTYENSGDLNTYYELGWELMITHPEIKKMKFNGVVHDEDFVVTANDERKFLYETQFKNVISWGEYIHLNIDKTNVVDLVNLSLTTLNELQYGINMFEVIKETNLVKILSDFKINEDIKMKVKNTKFVCLQFRKRIHSSERNIDDNFFRQFIDFVITNFKLNVYVMGFGSEIFCDNEKVFYVNLQEFTTLINDENCVLFYSTMSGPAHLSNFFTSKKTKHIVNDLTGCKVNDPNLINHPLYMGEIYNYVNADIEIVPFYRDIEFFKKTLSDLINQN